MKVTQKDMGFTLIEVMISLAVTAVLLVTLLYTLNLNLGIASRHETLTNAFMLGKQTMLEMKLRPSDDEGNYPEPYQDYAYKTEVKEYPFPGVSEFDVTVSIGKEKTVLKELVWTPQE